MNSPRLKTIFKAFTILAGLSVTLIIISRADAFFDFDKRISEKLESKKLLQTTEYFGAPVEIHIGQKIGAPELQSTLAKAGYRMRSSEQQLFEKDFSPIRESELQQIRASKPEVSLGFLIQSPGHKSNTLLALNSDNQIVLLQEAGVDQQSLILDAELLAQYVGNEPIMQEELQLSQIPPMCLNAIMSIEDQRFLEHGGVSVTGIMRAIGKNLILGKKAQGGSTITQQLVKNYFLTSEKTIKRKAQEIAMAIMLEGKFSKDEILQTYLNVIYMGQNGAFQVRGYGAAAKFYFSKPIADLNLGDCSLLAAIVNSPGLFNPFTKPENALKRRRLVLQKMLELNFISESEKNIAAEQALPKAPQSLASESAPYYLDAVRKQMQKLNLPIEGAKIYTDLSLQEQQWAQESLLKHIQLLESQNKKIKSIKEKKKKALEGIVLSIDRQSGLVRVAVGGKGFRQTQFNRITDAHRQVGSVMKPIVYLTALSQLSSDGKPIFTPATEMDDSEVTFRYEGQKWTPENYEGEKFGRINLATALKNSVNTITAKLAMEVGLDKIIDQSKRLGIESKLEAVPSLSLGAFELYPTEVAQAYLNIANFGSGKKLSFIRKAISSTGEVLYNQEDWNQKESSDLKADPIAAASLISMLKQTTISGTAKSIKLSGYDKISAGKTGTTSDNKDAWFVGFTPDRISLVWIGFDDNEKSGLTGASGALPIWIQFMKQATAQDSVHDFAWPEKVQMLNYQDMDLAFRKE